MFNGFNAAAIDQSAGSGLYFGGDYGAGWAWGVTNLSPMEIYSPGSSSPEFFQIVKDPGPAQPDNSGGGWLSPAQQVPYPGVYTPAAAAQPAQSIPYSQALQLPLTTQVAAALQTASAKLGTSSNYLLIGGGLLLLVLLMKK